MSWWAVWVSRGGHCFEMPGGRAAGSSYVRKTAHTKAATDLILIVHVWQEGPISIFSCRCRWVFADQAKTDIVVLSPPWLHGMVESR